ncbi:MAG: ATP-binding protein [Defluviitaleaceae bacterium]|nr:ATP-binding protein [Defluviitaleaceae bacterium]
MLAAHAAILYLQLCLIIYAFLNFKPERDMKVIVGIILAGLALLDVARHFYYGYQAIRWYGNIIAIGLPIILMLYALNRWRLWWLIGLSYIFVSFTNMIVAYFFFPVIQLDIEKLVTYAEHSALGGALGLSMLYLIYIATKQAKLELNVQGLSKGEITLLLIFLISFGFYVTRFYNLTGEIDFFNFLALMSGLVAIYVVLYLISKDTRLKEIEKREHEQQEMYEQQQLLFRKIEEQNLEMRRFKHDIDIELTKLYQHAGNENLKEIRLHIIEMRKDFVARSQVEWIETGINELNASLLNLTTTPAYQDIAFTWEGGIPEKISMSSRDRSLLFSNLFKNAFEAAAKCTTEKYVHVNVIAKENSLKIEIKNSFTGKIKQRPDGSFITTKKDKLNHGFGTITIKKIVEKYKGRLVFEHKANEFKVKIVFTKSIYTFD